MTTRLDYQIAARWHVPTIGREDILDRTVRHVLDPDVRAVTLVGPGGIGKTRVAHEVARRVLDMTNIPTTCIELGTTPTLEAAIAEVEAGASLTPGVLMHGNGPRTCDRPRLLILDGVEHLPDLAPLLGRLLDACPAVTLLATSRRPLRISQELVCEVEPLSLPTTPEVDSIEALARSASGALFLATARVVAPDNVLNNSQAADISAICRQVAGVPLAIQLAAGLLRTLPPALISANLANPLDVLAGGPVDQAPRLQSMRASVEWSHALLTGQEAIAFRRLGVFPDGFTLDSATRVIDLDAGSIDEVKAMEILSSLVDQSLLHCCQGRDGRSPRYRLDPISWACARERLTSAGELEFATASLAAWCISLAGANDGPIDHEARLGQLSEEASTFRAAREWIRDSGEWRLGFRLVEGLYEFWLTQGCSAEERQWVQDVLSMAQPPADTADALRLARVHHLLGLLSHGAAEFGTAEAAYRTALHMRRELPDRSAELDTLHNLAMLAMSRGHLEEARRLFAEPVTKARELGDATHLSNSLCYLASIQDELGDHDEAWRALEETGAIVREQSCPRVGAHYRFCLGNVVWNRELRREARQQWAESLERSARLGDAHSVASVHLRVARADRIEGAFADAVAHIHHTFEYLADRGDHRLLSESLIEHAALAAITDDLPWAAKVIGACDALLEQIGARLLPQAREERARIVLAIRKGIGEPATGTALAIGRSMQIDEVIAGALSCTATMLAPGADTDPLPGPEPGTVLTPRERDVLQLLAAGQTNREIGAALSIGHRTVATHVSNLLAKFDVATRAAVAGEAVRLGIVRAQTRSTSAARPLTT